MDFYEAYHFLEKHPMFNDMFTKGLDICVVKVDPETLCIEDDKTKNTKTNIWLETGPYLHNDPDGCLWGYDVDLDCGGDTFEEAIIKLAELVEKKYRRY